MRLKISQLNYGKCPAEKSPGNSRKKMFEPLFKKAFSRKFIIVFRKKRGNKLNLKEFSRKFIIAFR